MQKPFHVYFIDNFNYDESSSYQYPFSTYPEALAFAHDALDKDLMEAYRGGRNDIDTLYGYFVMFGSSPGIIGPTTAPAFSASDYFKQRAAQLLKDGTLPTAP